MSDNTPKIQTIRHLRKKHDAALEFGSERIDIGVYELTAVLSQLDAKDTEIARLLSQIAERDATIAKMAECLQEYADDVMSSDSGLSARRCLQIP